MIDAPTPADPTNQTSATFTFHSADGGVAFQCAIDAGAFAACTSGKAYASLPAAPPDAHVPRPRHRRRRQHRRRGDVHVDHRHPGAGRGDRSPTPADPTNATTATFAFHSPDGSATFTAPSTAAPTPRAARARATAASPAAPAPPTPSGSAPPTPPATPAAPPPSPGPSTPRAPPSPSIPSPPTPTRATTATFTFHSPSDAGATFECKLDGGAYAACSSGKSYSGLAGGAGTSHTFRVRATDAAGNTGSPAAFTWTVDTQGATVAIDSNPADPTRATTATFTFHSPSDADATFECKLDGGASPPAPRARATAA